ncbi:transglutaminaseTgpA domain-containing protein [Streptomyces niger]|uniref:transglutaminaseTgpA domain-containing protein n=1 Tax=Streptomyces niger TaxID=66373 RepID=UPI00069934FD|nr:transglutaminaseTgpA domain-containing protein [Streptomyces niger]
MSGRARLAVCAMVATLSAACALLPLVEPIGWVFQATILLALVITAGALARRVPLARPLTVAAQALIGLLLLTVLFTRGQAVAGVLPGPDAFREFGQLLQEGTSDVGRYAIPAPVTTGIRLLLVGGVVLIGLIVDALAVTYRSAAPAGLPLLALYSVAAGLSKNGAGWLWFLVAAAGYLLLLLAEGRDRLSRWGRVFGGGPTTAGRPYATAPVPPGGATPAPVRTGRRIGALALGIALIVPAALPSLSGGLLDMSARGGAGGAGGTISAVNPLVSLQDSLNQPEDREVLNYRTTTPDTRDLYLRIVALDQFDGAAWKPSQRTVVDVPDRLPDPPGLAPDVDTTAVNTSVSAARWYAQNWLPLPYPASRVDIPGRWRFEPEGRTLVGDRGQNTRGVRYQVESLIVRPTARQLADAPRPRPALRREYTRVPDSLPPVVERTAQRVTRGARSDYAKAVRLQDWFALRGGFTYNTEVRAGSGTQAITRFLEQKQGFCVHFAFSMAAMARTLGIPARVAVGFTPGGRRADGSYSVGLRDAHAWPELYFEGVGWTRFEPTPSRGSVPDYTVTADAPAEEDPGRAEPLPGRTAAPRPAEPSTDGGTCPPDQRRVAECGAVPGASGGGPADDGPAPGTLAAGALAVLLVLLLPAVPLLWRIRSRARRLARDRAAPPGAGPPDSGAAPPASGPGHRRSPAHSGHGAGGPPRSSLSRAGHAESGAGVADPRAGVPGSRTGGADARRVVLGPWRELVDSGWDYGIVPDDALTPRKAAERIVRVGELTGPAAEAAHRVAGAVEQALYAPHPEAAPGLAEDVRRVRAGLHAAASRGQRLRALLAPPSAVRLLWSASARASAVLGRLRTAVPGRSAAR